MSLTGDISSVYLTDILQALSANGRPGVLVIRSGRREKRIAFSSRGMSLLSGRTINGFPMGRFLVGRGVIREEDLRFALERQKETGARLGETLVSLGLCREEDVQEAARYQAAEEIYDLLTWNDGVFSFEDAGDETEIEDSHPFARFHFQPDEIVLETARRMQEWSRFRKKIPDDREIFVHTFPAKDPPDPAVEGRDLAAVYWMVNGYYTVSQILSGSHLSTYDTGVQLIRLLDEGYIRSAREEELVQAARREIQKGNPRRAVEILESARREAPRDLSILRPLAEIRERLGERDEAAKVFHHIGEILLEGGQWDDGIAILEKAARLDLRSELSPLRLVKEHLAGGRFDKAARRALQAAEILSEREEYDRAIEVCRQVLEHLPDHLGLGRMLANLYLKVGREQEALKQLDRVATILEVQRRHSQLAEVYRKMLQLDPSRQETLRRLREVERGPAVRNTRRWAAVLVLGPFLVAAAVAFVLVSGGEKPGAALNRAWGLLQSGKKEEARRVVTRLIVDHPGTEWEREGRKLLAVLDGRSARAATGDPRERRYRDVLESRFRKAVPSEAAEISLEAVSKFLDYLDGEECARLETGLDPVFRRRTRESYVSAVRGLLADRTKEWLRGLGEIPFQIRSLRVMELETMTLDRLEEGLDRAGKLREVLDPAELGGYLERLAAIERRLGDEHANLAASMRERDAEIRGLHAEVSDCFHRIRARLLGRKLRHEFYRVYPTLAAILEKGDLEEVERRCRAVLDRCDELARAAPRGIYEPVSLELLGKAGLDLDGKMRSILDRVEEIRGEFARAEDLFRRGAVERGNRVLLDLLEGHPDMNLEPRVRLCFLARSRPRGAEVLARSPDGSVRSLGRTGEHGVPVRFPPGASLTLVLRKPTFEEAEFPLTKAVVLQTPGTEFRLKKKVAWEIRTGAPLEGNPAFWKDRMLVAGRDGTLRVYEADTGKRIGEIPLDLLSGCSASPLVLGDRAWLGTLDHKLLLLDLPTGEVVRRFDLEGPVSTPPVVAGRTVVVVDDRGVAGGYRDRKRAWTRDLGGRLRAPPASAGGFVFVATAEGVLQALEARTGTVRWTRKLAAPVRNLPFAGEKGPLLVISDAPAVAALSRETGEIRWTAPLPCLSRCRAALVGGEVAVLAKDGTLLGLDPRTGGRTRTRKIPAGSSLDADLLAREDLLFTVSTAGRLLAIRPGGGIEWSFDLGERVRRPPVAHGRKLYVATEKGRIFCFDRPAEAAR